MDMTSILARLFGGVAVRIAMIAVGLWIAAKGWGFVASAMASSGSALLG